MSRVVSIDLIDNILGQSIAIDLPNPKSHYELEGVDVYLHEANEQVTIVIAPMSGLSQVISLK